MLTQRGGALQESEAFFVGELLYFRVEVGFVDEVLRPWIASSKVSQDPQGHGLNRRNIRPDDFLKVVPLATKEGSGFSKLAEDSLTDKEAAVEVRLRRNRWNFVCHQGNATNPG